MLRRLWPFLALGLLVAMPASADRRQQIEAKIATLNAQVAQARQKQDALQGQIDGLSVEIRALEHKVGDVSARLDSLGAELELRELRLNRLSALLQLETDRLHFLKRQYRIALSRLNQRLVTIYESDPEDTLSVVLAADTLTDALDKIDYTKQIGAQDELIATEVHSGRDRVRAQLENTRVARLGVLAEAQAVAYRVRQVREVRDELLASRDKLASRRAEHQDDLDRLSEKERNEEDEIAHLRAADQALTARIQAAEASAPADTTPSSYGLIWPVNGPITSGFGPRWGSFHYGLDIGAGYGTPIHAAAAGVVIYAGWYDGFGNFVVVDHGGGLATTYGHQSRIVVSVGERVAQGQLLGYVGSTGFSTGPHLDFEVRVNGTPVDPLGYL
jgi:murein DD-endopeptidase MepM/ murein hydrolase activator NlpD